MLILMDPRIACNGFYRELVPLGRQIPEHFLLGPAADRGPEKKIETGRRQRGEVEVEEE